MAEQLVLKNVKGGTAERTADLLDDYFKTNDECDVDLTVGIAHTGEGVAVIQVDGGRHHPFSSGEARALATIIENLLSLNPSVLRKIGADDLILLLRLGADKADELAQASLSSSKLSN